MLRSSRPRFSFDHHIPFFDDTLLYDSCDLNSRDVRANGDIPEALGGGFGRGVGRRSEDVHGGERVSIYNLVRADALGTVLSVTDGPHRPAVCCLLILQRTQLTHGRCSPTSQLGLLSPTFRLGTSSPLDPENAAYLIYVGGKHRHSRL